MLRRLHGQARRRQPQEALHASTNETRLLSAAARLSVPRSVHRRANLATGIARRLGRPSRRPNTTMARDAQARDPRRPRCRACLGRRRRNAPRQLSRIAPAAQHSAASLTWTTTPGTARSPLTRRLRARLIHRSMSKMAEAARPDPASTPAAKILQPPLLSSPPTASKANRSRGLRRTTTWTRPSRRTHSRRTMIQTLKSRTSVSCRFPSMLRPQQADALCSPRLQFEVPDGRQPDRLSRSRPLTVLRLLLRQGVEATGSKRLVRRGQLRTRGRRTLVPTTLRSRWLTHGISFRMQVPPSPVQVPAPRQAAVVSAPSRLVSVLPGRRMHRLLLRRTVPGLPLPPTTTLAQLDPLSSRFNAMRRRTMQGSMIQRRTSAAPTAASISAPSPFASTMRWVLTVVA